MILVCFNAFAQKEKAKWPSSLISNICAVKNRHNALLRQQLHASGLSEPHLHRGEDTTEISECDPESFRATESSGVTLKRNDSQSSTVSMPQSPAEHQRTQVSSKDSQQSNRPATQNPPDTTERSVHLKKTPGTPKEQQQPAEISGRDLSSRGISISSAPSPPKSWSPAGLNVVGAHRASKTASVSPAPFSDTAAVYGNFFFPY